MSLWSVQPGSPQKNLRTVKLLLQFVLKKPADCKSFTLWFVFSSFFSFLSFFYSSHLSDTVSRRFPLRQTSRSCTVIYAFVDMYMCHELFHVVAPLFISVNSCTFFFDSDAAWTVDLRGSFAKRFPLLQTAWFYCGDGCEDELYFLEKIITEKSFGIWMWNNGIFASPRPPFPHSLTQLFSSLFFYCLKCVALGDQQGVLVSPQASF